MGAPSQRLVVEADQFDRTVAAGLTTDTASFALIVRCPEPGRRFLEPRQPQLLDGAAFLDGQYLHVEIGQLIDLGERGLEAVLVEVGEAVELAFGHAQHGPELIDREFLMLFHQADARSTIS